MMDTLGLVVSDWVVQHSPSQWYSLDYRERLDLLLHLRDTVLPADAASRFRRSLNKRICFYQRKVRSQASPPRRERAFKVRAYPMPDERALEIFRLEAEIVRRATITVSSEMFVVTDIATGAVLYVMHEDMTDPENLRLARMECFHQLAFRPNPLPEN